MPEAGAGKKGWMFAFKLLSPPAPKEEELLAFTALISDATELPAGMQRRTMQKELDVVCRLHRSIESLAATHLNPPQSMDTRFGNACEGIDENNTIINILSSPSEVATPREAFPAESLYLITLQGALREGEKMAHTHLQHLPA